MTKISVVVPTFNRAHTIERALNSLLAQTSRPHEILVIDDGSIDDTPERVAKWRTTADFSGHFVYRQTENLGVSSARNLGARLATGDALAFLDSDDEWLPHKLRAQVPLLKYFKLVHGGETWIRDGHVVPQLKKHQKSGGRIFSRCVDICCVSPSTVLIDKDLFDSLNGFRVDFPVCEDYELWLRISAKHDVGFVAEPVIRKYAGHDQLSMRYKAMDFYRARALVPFLNSIELSEAERAHVIQTLTLKCEILIRGYQRHDNPTDLTTVQGWLERALNASSALQTAHSVAERRPRSEFSETL